MTDQVCIAALFVQADGCYSKLPYVDAWSANRDATNYRGPYPVVAHPPCQLWGNLARVNYARWGGEHNKPGNDKGLFSFALSAVRRWGGVLEHPAHSKAFAAHGLPTPSSMGWQRVLDGGWICEVWQSAYGHRANKATWLYYYGNSAPKQIDTRRVIGEFQIGGCDQRGKDSNKPTLGKKESSATPYSFRDYLIGLAINASKTKEAERHARNQGQ